MGRLLSHEQSLHPTSTSATVDQSRKGYLNEKVASDTHFLQLGRVLSRDNPQPNGF